MKELVKRGVKALPDLIAHLSDEREIRLSISQHGFAGATCIATSTTTIQGREATSKEVNTGKEEGLTKPYALRVGDLSLCCSWPDRKQTTECGYGISQRLLRNQLTCHDT